MRPATVSARAPSQPNWWDAETEVEAPLIEKPEEEREVEKPKRQYPGGIRCYHYIVQVTMLLVLATLCIASFFAWQAIVLSTRNNEECQERPLEDFLLASGVHSAISSITLISYILCLEMDMRRSGRPAHLHAFQGGNFALFAIETLLVLLSICQAALGILSEVWTGALGIVKRPSALGCSRSAPTAYRAVKYIGLYECWIIVFLAILLITIIFSACSGAGSKASLSNGNGAHVGLAAENKRQSSDGSNGRASSR